MGTLDGAICIGFICRLCSRPARSVVFIFGTRGVELDLPNKINSYLPIEVREDDDLPKTICEKCVTKIIQHHQMMERIHQVQKQFQTMRNESMSQQDNLETRSTDTSDADIAHQSDREPDETAEHVQESAEETLNHHTSSVEETATNTDAPMSADILQSTDEPETVTDSVVNRSEEVNSSDRTRAVRRKRKHTTIVKTIKKRVKRRQ